MMLLYLKLKQEQKNYLLQVSVIQYGKPAEIKKDINERFKESFPNANITLSKLRRYGISILHYLVLVFIFYDQITQYLPHTL